MPALAPYRTGILPEERIDVGFYWRTTEERLLRELYPNGGARACLPVLPGRSKNAIHNRAIKLGLRIAGRRSAAAPAMAGGR